MNIHGKHYDSRDAVILYLATGGKSGCFPVAPGTFGSLAALLPCWILSLFSMSESVIFLLIFIILAVWTAESAEKLLEQRDPACIVIDEFAGMMITMIGFPFMWKSALTGFLLFRILDIAKPFPIRHIENLSGGAGVVLDDMSAGIIAHLILKWLFYIPWMT